MNAQSHTSQSLTINNANVTRIKAPLFRGRKELADYMKIIHQLAKQETFKHLLK